MTPTAVKGGTAVIALAALLGGLMTLLVAPASSAARQDPAYGMPPVGACYDMGWKELHSPTYVEAPVDCAGTHTAMTLSVTFLPDRLSWQESSDRKLGRATNKACWTAAAATLGGTAEERSMTAYSMAFFRPTKAQLAAGARWLRCDLIAYGGRKDLAPIPAAPVATPLTDETRACLVGDKGYDTVCSRKHQWRVTGAVTARLVKYPGDRAMRELAIRRCRDQVVRKRPYWFRWHLAEPGNRRLWIIECYSRTSR